MIPIYVLNHADGGQWRIEEPVVLADNVVGDMMRRIRLILSQQVQEPLDNITRTYVANRGQAYLNERVVSRIIADGKVVCDMSNNTEDMLKRNQIVVTVFVKRLCGDEVHLSFSNQPMGAQYG